MSEKDNFGKAYRANTGGEEKVHYVTLSDLAAVDIENNKGKSFRAVQQDNNKNKGNGGEK